MLQSRARYCQLIEVVVFMAGSLQTLLLAEYCRGFDKVLAFSAARFRLRVGWPSFGCITVLVTAARKLSPLSTCTCSKKENACLEKLHIHGPFWRKVLRQSLPLCNRKMNIRERQRKGKMGKSYNSYVLMRKWTPASVAVSWLHWSGCDVPSLLHRLVQGKGAQLGHGQSLAPCPGLSSLHMAVNLSCLLCATAVTSAGARSLLTSLTSRSSVVRKERRESSPWPCVHLPSPVCARDARGSCRCQHRFFCTSLLEVGCTLQPLLASSSGLQSGGFFFDYYGCKSNTTIMGAVRRENKWQPLSERVISPGCFVGKWWGSSLLMHQLFRHMGNV